MSDQGTGIDIENEQSLMMLSALHEGVILFYADGHRCRANAKAEHILGMTAEQIAKLNEDATGWCVIQEDGQPCPLDAFPALVTLRTGQPQMEKVMGVLKPHGELVWLSVSCNPLFHAGEAQPYAVVASFIDITHYRQTELALRKSADEYRRLFESANEGLIIFEPASHLILQVNQQSCAMYGYTAKELRFHDVAQVMGDMTDLETEILPALQQDMVESLEMVHFTCGRRPIDVQCTFSPIEYRGCQAVLVSTRHISTRKQAEQVLRQSEERFSKVFQASPTPTCITTLAEGRFIDVNDRYLQFFGYTRQELIGRKTLDLKTWLQDDERGHLIERLRAQGSVHNWESRIRTRSGEIREALASYELIELAGEPCILTLIEDITERKQAERVLIAAREAALEASRMKSEFLANMSHEIRTPLTAMLGYSELLLLEADGPLSPEQAEDIKLILNSGRHLLSVINDILDYSKIEAGKVEIYLQPCDLDNCIGEALQFVQGKAEDKGLALFSLSEPNLSAPFLGDSLRIRQVLINLMSNAVKFTERGKVVVHSRLLKQQGGHDEVMISIKDSGIGIPADKLGRLFQSFSQLESAASRRFGGTGLGLAISQRLVALMGGRMWVESVEGQGSTFYFTLPYQPVALEAIVDDYLEGICA